MELDDFKLKNTNPDISGDGSGRGTPNGLDSLIEELKAADTKRRKMVFMFMIIILALTVINSTTILTKSGLAALGYEILVFGFVLILIYFFSQLLSLKKVDYTAPSLVFLQKAEKRYAFMKPSDWIIVTPLLLILGAGGGLIVYHSFSKYNVDIQLITAGYILFFIALVIFGFWASRKDWKKDNGRILERIREIREEMELEG